MDFLLCCPIHASLACDPCLTNRHFKAVEQEAPILNDGDNFMAWESLRQLIEDGRPLPDCAAKYFLKIAAAMEAFDPHEDDALDLLRALEVSYSPRAAQRKRKEKVDYDDIYWCISKWLREGIPAKEGVPKKNKDETIADCVQEYIDQSERKDREPLEFETVRSAYNTVRKEWREAMDQERPSLTIRDLRRTIQD